jgi:hypothetical protein
MTARFKCATELRFIRWNSAVASLVLGLFVGFAGTAKADAMATAGSPGVSSYLTPQRTLDLEALRRSGVSGAVDLSGYRVTMRPGSGSMEAVPGKTERARAAGDENWWNEFGSPGLTEAVRAMAVYNGSLIVSGEFTTIGSVTVNHIARWDGTSWYTLGDWLDSVASCFHLYDGKLIAGGWFGWAVDVNVNRVAAWDGTSWSALGSGFNNSAVYALGTYNGQLVAGGDFDADASGGQPMRHLATWSGTTWTQLGGGADSPVTGLSVFGEELIMGGTFVEIGGQSIARIARWDGMAWSAMGAWPPGEPARSFVEYGGALYAGYWDNVVQWTGTEMGQHWIPGIWRRYGSLHIWWPAHRNRLGRRAGLRPGRLHLDPARIRVGLGAGHRYGRIRWEALRGWLLLPRG